MQLSIIMHIFNIITDELAILVKLYFDIPATCHLTLIRVLLICLNTLFHGQKEYINLDLECIFPLCMVFLLMVCISIKFLYVILRERGKISEIWISKCRNYI